MKRRIISFLFLIGLYLTTTQLQAANYTVCTASGDLSAAKNLTGYSPLLFDTNNFGPTGSIADYSFSHYHLDSADADNTTLATLSVCDILWVAP